MPDESSNPMTGHGAQFAATSWTNVLAAQRSGTPGASQALERLCQAYWYPLYAYVRRRGNDPHKAQDLTQEFFYRLIRENYLGAVDRRRGKFRSFLLASMNHFLSNQRDFERAAKRGGGQPLISLDDTDAETRFLKEPASELSPEKIFERNWFLALFDQALARLREEVQTSGRAEAFDQLKQFILDEAEPGDYSAAAGTLHMTPNAVAVTVHRWRERYKKLVREEVERTVVEHGELDEELNRFFAALQR